MNGTAQCSVGYASSASGTSRGLERLAVSFIHSWWAKNYLGTPAELALEPAIASLGLPYRFQHPLFLWGTRFFPDFCLPTIGVIVEVDDPSHATPERQEKDAERTRVLESLGYVVVRCTNHEALTDPWGVVERVRPYLSRVGPGLPKPLPRRKRTKPTSARK